MEGGEVKPVKRRRKVYVLAGKKVRKGTPGAVEKIVYSKEYYLIEMRSLDNGKRVNTYTKLSTDKGVSAQMIGTILKNRERAKVGLPPEPVASSVAPPTATPPTPSTPALPPESPGLLWEEVVKEYLVHVGETSSEQHAKNCSWAFGKLTRDLQLQGKPLSVITVEKVDAFLASLSCGATTKRYYRTRVVALFNYLRRKGKLEGHRMSNVTVARGKTLRRRRALTLEEVRRLLDATSRRPAEMISESPRRRWKEKWGVENLKAKQEYVDRALQAGKDRRLVYLAAVYTGLRRKELASLRVCDFQPEGKPFPYLELPGDETKNKNAARQYLAPAFSRELQEYAKGKKPGDKLLRVWGKMSRAFAKDLAFAGVDKTDERGRVADFHSLRKTCNTVLSAAKVPLRLRQLFMRHRKVDLTAETYDDEGGHDWGALVKALAAAAEVITEKP